MQRKPQSAARATGATGAAAGAVTTGAAGEATGAAGAAAEFCIGRYKFPCKVIDRHYWRTQSEGGYFLPVGDNLRDTQTRWDSRSEGKFTFLWRTARVQ